LNDVIKGQLLHLDGRWGCESHDVCDSHTEESGRL